MSSLLREDGRTLHAKVFERIWQPTKPEPEDLEAFVEVLFDGRLIREAIRHRQESVEEMRPLPTKFDSVVDLIAHLIYLDFVTAWPLARAEDREQGRKFRVAYHKYSVDMATFHLENRLPLELQRQWLGPDIPCGDLERRIAIYATPVEQYLIGALGGGRADRAWGHALKMVDEGIEGGIRALRHMVLANAIRRHTMSDLEGCYAHVLKAEEGCRARCFDGMAAIIAAADPERRPLAGRDVFLSWRRTAEAYIGALLGELMPAELG